MKHALSLIATLFALAVPAAAAGVSPLPFRVVDAEFSAELNALVMISAAPNQLHVYFPDTRQLTSIDLPPIAPSSVSVSPDGLAAAVGHDAWISYVDLTTKSVRTLPVSIVVFDVVLAGNGWIYAFPKQDQWCNIVGVEIATGRETESHGSIYAGTIGRLHPSGSAMYGADRGISPSDIEKYDISKGAPEVLYDSPYHGDYPMCGNLWFSQDGNRIFTACSYSFWSSASKESDMKYAGRLADIGAVRWVSHSRAARLVAAIGNASSSTNPPSQFTDVSVWFFNDEFLERAGKAELPPFVRSDGKEFASHGRFVFFDKSGLHQYVLVQADATAQAENDWGVVTLEGMQASSADEQYILGVASAPGASGTNWKTDLDILNASSQSATIRVDLLRRGESNEAPSSTTITLPAGAAVRYRDALQGLFGYTGGATLRLQSSVSGITTASATYNDQPSGTYGCALGGFRPELAIRKDQVGTMLQLSHSIDRTTGHRTNLGLQNLSASATTVLVTAKTNQGALLGTKSLKLRSFEFVQYDSIFTQFTANSVAEGYLFVTCSEPSCAFAAYSSMVDNKSGDPTCVIAR